MPSISAIQKIKVPPGYEHFAHPPFTIKIGIKDPVDDMEKFLEFTKQPKIKIMMMQNRIKETIESRNLVVLNIQLLKIGVCLELRIGEGSSEEKVIAHLTELLQPQLKKIFFQQRYKPPAISNF